MTRLTEASQTTPSEMTVCLLASGSRGNAIYVSDGTTRILVDAGLSGKAIERRMELREIVPSSIDAIVVSHEHSDHIQGVGVLSRRFQLPVYISQTTHKQAAAKLGRLHETVTFTCGESFAVNGLKLHPFPTSHDAVDPAGFTIEANGYKVGIATDLGVVTHMVRNHLKECAVLVLEANHDPAMLMDGPYPWPLKQRIKGRTGHLANEDTCQLIEDLAHDNLKHVILAHLSETNNSLEKAVEKIRIITDRLGVQLTVATQDQCSCLIQLKS